MQKFWVMHVIYDACWSITIMTSLTLIYIHIYSSIGALSIYSHIVSFLLFPFLFISRIPFLCSTKSARCPHCRHSNDQILVVLGHQSSRSRNIWPYLAKLRFSWAIWTTSILNTWTSRSFSVLLPIYQAHEHEHEHDSSSHCIAFEQYYYFSFNFWSIFHALVWETCFVHRLRIMRFKCNAIRKIVSAFTAAPLPRPRTSNDAAQ